MATRAIRFLKKTGVRFEVKTYAHEQKGAVFAAGAIGFPLEKTIKTLVVDLGPKGHVLVLMPGNRKLSLKRLSQIFSTKQVSMAKSAAAERLTGYTVGGISPFGTQQKLPVLMEASLLEFKQVAVNGGKRGLMLKMNPQDIASVLGCEVVRLI